MFTYLRILARPATATGRAFSTTSARPIARMTIVGHLGYVPELHATSTGRDVIKYRIASNSGNVENRRTSWFTVNAFETEGPRRDFLLGLEKGYVELESRTADSYARRACGWSQCRLEPLGTTVLIRSQHAGP